MNYEPPTINISALLLPMLAAEKLPYNKTHSFTKIVLDYLAGEGALENFYAFPPTIVGLKAALQAKQAQHCDRASLVEVLKDQYSNCTTTEAVTNNIQSLLSNNTFTICTAHQPNLLTGPLYFIYKILHAIKLAQHLQLQFTGYKFVPVFYLGSEDADLQELNHFTVQGKKYTWDTQQKGAVGRMKIDKKLTALITELEYQIGVEPHGSELIGLFKQFFIDGKEIQDATFQLANALFGKYGLVVLIADDPRLKRSMLPVFEKDLLEQEPSRIVSDTSSRLAAHYNVQAHARDINLFYLKDDVRERIERRGDSFVVVNTSLSFTKEEMLRELNTHPERFSPNVILRGLFQETILPNIAFIGGGGELAYWLQLKDLFVHYNIVFPALILRNSFLVIEAHQHELMEKLGVTIEDIFRNELDLMNLLLERKGLKPHLNGEVSQLGALYDALTATASSVDPTLDQHVRALKTRTLNQLQELEKKMLRAERKKDAATARQIAKLKQQLFPKGGLQERVENLSSYYTKWGSGFIDELLQHSLSIEQEFVVLTDQKN